MYHTTMSNVASMVSRRHRARSKDAAVEPHWLSGAAVWNPDDDPGFLMSDLARQMRTAFERRIISTGLTGTQWRALVYLFRKDGMTQTELSVEVDVERASMGSVLDKLEVADFITRRSDPEDRRVRRVFVTEKATALIPIMAKEASGLYAELFAGFPPEQRRLAIDLLSEMRSRLRRM